MPKLFESLNHNEKTLINLIYIEMYNVRQSTIRVNDCGEKFSFL